MPRISSREDKYAAFASACDKDNLSNWFVSWFPAVFQQGKLDELQFINFNKGSKAPCPLWWIFSEVQSSSWGAPGRPRRPRRRWGSSARPAANRKGHTWFWHLCCTGNLKLVLHKTVCSSSVKLFLQNHPYTEQYASCLLRQ